MALLRSRGHDVLWIHQSHPGLGDDSVLEKALTESRLLITFDKDFGELVFHKGAKASCGIVLFRVSMPSPGKAAQKVVTSLESRSDWQNQFSVVEDAMVRMRLEGPRDHWPLDTQTLDTLGSSPLDPLYLTPDT